LPVCLNRRRTLDPFPTPSNLCPQKSFPPSLHSQEAGRDMTRAAT
jgi:hypothetical protein